MAGREAREFAVLGEEAFSPSSDFPKDLCIQALAYKGTPAALEQLALYALHPDQQTRTALWKAWKRFDPQIYAARILGHVRKVTVIAPNDELLLRNLSYLPNLEELIIRNGYLLWTLSFLSAFPQLTTLRVDSLVHIRDLSILGTLTQLTTLEILFAPNIIEDFHWINSLQKLTWLRFEDRKKIYIGSSVDDQLQKKLERRGYRVCRSPEKAGQKLRRWGVVRAIL